MNFISDEVDVTHSMLLVFFSIKSDQKFQLGINLVSSLIVIRSESIEFSLNLFLVSPCYDGKVGLVDGFGGLDGLRNGGSIFGGTSN